MPPDAHRLEQLRALLVDVSGDQGSPVWLRTDAAVMLDSLNQIQRAVAVAEAVEREIPAQELLATESADGVKRSAMHPLPGWIVDTGVMVERMVRAVDAGQPLLLTLSQTLGGVRRGNPLGDQLHAQVETVAAWYLALRRQVVGDDG